MNGGLPEYPHQSNIPGTNYYLQAIHAWEFRMGCPYCNLRILDGDGAIHIDLAEWDCYPGLRASDFLKQSKNNPHILLLPILITERQFKKRTKGTHQYMLKINIQEQTYRIGEREESLEDINSPFYPVCEMHQMKTFLETFIEGAVERQRISKFHI